MPILVQYLRNKDFVSWDEIHLLCKIIDFPVKAFTQPDQHNESNSYLSNEWLEGIPLDAFDPLFYNLNFQEAVENHSMLESSGLINLFAFCLELLQKKSFTFEEIRAAQRAYDFYVDNTSSIPASETVVLKAIQLSGKICCPLWIARALKAHRSTGQKNLQSLEFLKLVAECLPSSDINVNEEEAKGKDERGLFNLCNFDTLFVPYEERKKRVLEEKLKAELIEEKMKRLKELDEKAIAEAIQKRQGKAHQYTSDKPDLEVCREKYHMMLRDNEKERVDVRIYTVASFISILIV